MCSLPVQETRSLKSRKAGRSSLRPVSENPFHAFFVAFGDCQQALALLGLGMNHSNFQPVFIWSVPSLCMSLSVFSSYKDTSHWIEDPPYSTMITF